MEDSKHIYTWDKLYLRAKDFLVCPNFPQSNCKFGHDRSCNIIYKLIDQAQLADLAQLQIRRKFTIEVIHAIIMWKRKKIKHDWLQIKRYQYDCTQQSKQQNTTKQSQPSMQELHKIMWSNVSSWCTTHTSNITI